MSNTPQVQRLLNLIPYLQRHEFVEVSKVAEDFGVTAKQVLSDLEVLQFCGLPDGLYDDLFHVDLEGAREDGFISFRNADVLTRPRKLRVDEASSLVVALESLLELSGGSDAASSALAKLREVMGDIEAPVSVSVAAGNPEHRDVLRRAIEEHEVVELAYTASSGGPSVAEVEPALLRIVDGIAYLEAWSRYRRDWRSYRLDRMDSVTPTGEQFAPRPDVPEADAPWFRDADQLTLVVEPAAQWLLEYLPVTSAERGDDRVTMTLPLGSRSWATGLLLRLGSRVLDVSDESLAAAAGGAAAEALRRYAGATGTDCLDPDPAG